MNAQSSVGSKNVSEKEAKRRIFFLFSYNMNVYRKIIKWKE